MFLCALILVCALNLVKNEESPFTRKTLEETWEERLIKDLKSRDTYKTAPNKTTEVNVHYFLKRFTVGEDETTFEAFSWVILSWKDPRLKWNASDYYGIAEVIYEDYALFWKPWLRLLSREDDLYDMINMNYGQCNLNMDGNMTCIPRVLHEAPCNTILTNWPYDFQKCNLQMILFAFNANVEIDLDEKSATLLGAEYGSEWMILDYTETIKAIDSPIRNLDKASQFELTFLIQREGEGLAAIVIFPTVLLSLLTLCSFLLNVKDYMRLGMLCFNLLCHFLFITELSDLIPKHSDSSPTILLYLRDSVLINISLVLFTMFLIILRKITRPVPSWIGIINDTVMKGRARFLVWPRWTAEFPKGISVEIHTAMSQWADFSDAINSFFLWLVMFLYVYYICAYIPRQSLVDSVKL